MIATATARRAHSTVAAAVRDHGPDSPEAYAARRRHHVLKAASRLIGARPDQGWTPAERDVLLAALDGQEVSAP